MSNSSYVKMADILLPVKIGNVEVDIFTIKDDPIAYIRSGISPGSYARLKVGSTTMMSDTPMEQRTNLDFIHNAHGDVLIGGLGIGLIILAIQDNPEVSSITVLEANQNVIDAVKPQLPLNDKVRIIFADAFKWNPDRKFDCIYMDIWPYINSDIYRKEMVPLKRKYGHYLKPLSESPKRFNRCWAEHQAKNNFRL